MAAQIHRDEMDEYFELWLDIDNDQQRENLLDAGFDSVETIAKRNTDFAHKVCQLVRKNGAGGAAGKNASIATEESLTLLILLQRLNYICERDVDFDQADEETLERVNNWFDQVKQNEPKEGIKPFTEGANKKIWFESIENYFAAKAGPSGVPLSYVIRDDAGLPAEDPGFGVPDFDHEVATRGRHNGHFWENDNKTVWNDIKDAVHGTTAWSTIKRFARTKNGRDAFRALELTFMGNDVRLLLSRRADNVLNMAVYDGKSKNWTWEKHVDRLRNAFQDLEAAGNPHTPRMQVQKLNNSFQFLPLAHVPSLIDNDARYQADFERAQGFIKGQLASLRLKNASINKRTIAGLGTNEEEEGEEEETQQPVQARIKKAKRKLAKLQAKIRKGSKKLDAAKKRSGSGKIKEGQPGAYVSAEEWQKMTPEQKTKAREARLKAGIKPRSSIKSITTKPDEEEKVEVEESEAEPEEEKKRPASKISTIRQVPKSLLKAPSIKRVKTTQREDYYAINGSQAKRVGFSATATVRKFKAKGAGEEEEI